MLTNVALRGLRTQKLRGALHEARGTLEGLDGFTVCAVVRLLENQFDELPTAEIQKLGFDILRILEDGEFVEIVIVAGFGQNLKCALTAAQILRDILCATLMQPDSPTDHTAASIAVGRHLFSALQGIQQFMVPKIDLDPELPGIDELNMDALPGFEVLDLDGALNSLESASEREPVRQ